MNKALPALVGAVVLLSACGTRVEPSIGTPPPSPTATSTPTASGAATAGPGATPTGTAGASSAASASPTTAPSSWNPSASPGATAVASPSATAAASASPAAGLPQGSDPVTLDPANFVAVIDNPWWPMAVGSEWEYTETDADGTVAKVKVTVTDETKQIQGITATVVHDVLTEDGEVVEDTFDWYAQDVDGNIWYLGEDTKEFENGHVVTTEGSWEAGVDGAFAGVIIPAQPTVGLTYRQEYLAGEAEDQATVLSLDEQAEVPAGAYQNLMLTKEFTPVEPDVLEYKWYAQGVGQVLAITVSGGSDREELDKYTPGSP